MCVIPGGPTVGVKAQEVTEPSAGVGALRAAVTRRGDAPGSWL